MGMGDERTVQALLQRGAEPNCVDKENRTPLYIAAENGYVAVCRCLLDLNISDEESDEDEAKAQSDAELKVDIHLASKSGKTPLYVSSENGHVEVVSFLLERGSNVRQETCRGKIPLYAAAEKQFASIVKAILPYTLEADLFKLTHYGTTAMFIASKQSNKAVKKMLVDFCHNKHRKVKVAPALKAAHIEEAARPATPKFAEEFEHSRELKQRRKRQSHVLSSKSTTTPFLARLEQTDNGDENSNSNEEEKEKSVPRVLEEVNRDNHAHSQRMIRARQRRSRPHQRVAVPKKEKVVLERKEEEETPSTDSSTSTTTAPKKCAFDYNRLYRGRSRNVSEASTEEKESEN